MLGYLIIIALESPVNEYMATLPFKYQQNSHNMLLSYKLKLFGHNATNITIDTIMHDWHHTFHHLILKNNSINLIMAQTPNKNYFSSLLLDSYYILNNKIIGKNAYAPGDRDGNANHKAFLLQLSSPNYKYSFHDMTCLRRQIMIIIRYYGKDTLRPFDYFVYNKIIEILSDIDDYNKQHRIKNKHQWFHLHVSKAAGTSVKSTFIRIFDAKYSTYLISTLNLNCTDQYKYSRNKAIAKWIMKSENKSIIENNTHSGYQWVTNKYNLIDISGYESTLR